MSENKTEGQLRVIDDIYCHPAFKEIYASLPDHLKPMVDDHITSLTSRINVLSKNLRDNIINQDRTMDLVAAADEALYTTFSSDETSDEEGEE
jgi:hypothetical protein